MLSTQEYNMAVREYSRNIFRYVFKCIRDEESTNDIVQDSFIKLWNHRNNIDPTKIRYWLFATAHNTMLNYIKKASRTVILENGPEIESYLNLNHQFELRELIDKALEMLPQVQKTIILLRDLEGYDYKEIGEILQLSESQVKVYLFRARQKMKNSLKELSDIL